MKCKRGKNNEFFLSEVQPLNASFEHRKPPTIVSHLKCYPDCCYQRDNILSKASVAELRQIKLQGNWFLSGHLDFDMQYQGKIPRANPTVRNQNQLPLFCLKMYGVRAV